MLYIKIDARFVAHPPSSILSGQASAQSVSVVAERMRLPSVILQLIKRKYNYKTKLSITKILNWDWLFAMQFLEC